MQKLDLYKAIRFLASPTFVGIHLFEYMHFVMVQICSQSSTPSYTEKQYFQLSIRNGRNSLPL